MSGPPPHHELARPLWYALKLTDLRGEPLEGVRVTLSCSAEEGEPQGRDQGESGEGGWVFGALPSECLVGEGFEPISTWRLSTAESEQVRSAQDLTPTFTPYVMSGSWELSPPKQHAEHISYQLSHNTQLPHPLKARLEVRPCLSVEEREGRPVSYPYELLQERLLSEGLKVKTLREAVVAGPRLLSLSHWEPHVGCYVLSASSTPGPHWRLLESRALFFVKGALELTNIKMALERGEIELSGDVEASPSQVSWSAERWEQTLKALRLTASLFEHPELSWEAQVTPLDEPPLDEPDRLKGRWSLSLSLDELYQRLHQGRFVGDLPQHEELAALESGSGSESLFLQLTLSETPLSVERSTLYEQPLPPPPTWLQRLLRALMRLDVWLAIAVISALARPVWAWAQGQLQRGRAWVRRHLTPRVKRARPRWSTRQTSPLSSRGEGAASGSHSPAQHARDALSLTLINVSTGEPLALAYAALSEPTLMMSFEPSDAEPPLAEPLAPLHVWTSSRERSPHAELNEPSWLSLPATLKARLEAGEPLWLWVRAEGCEGCVLQLKAEHLSQQLTCPLWPLRDALKRQLTALCQRRGLKARFGRAAFASLRAELEQLTQGQLTQEQLTQGQRALRSALFEAEAYLYDHHDLSVERALALAWALSEGYEAQALSPYDERALRLNASPQRVTRLSSSSALLMHLFVVLICVSGSLCVGSLNAQAKPIERYTRLVSLASERCEGEARAQATLSYQTLIAPSPHRVRVLMMMNPTKLPIELIEWVRAGGSLLVALEPSSLTGAGDFLKRLDLITPSAQSTETTQGHLVGLWWSVSALEAERRPPFVGASLAHFVEGGSWYDADIPPSWVDERGRSIGYQVGIGEGRLALIGDSDAWRDDLMRLKANKRAATALIDWLLKPHQKLAGSPDDCPLILTSPALIEGAPSSWSSEFLGGESRLSSLLKSASELLASAQERFKRLLKAPFTLQLLAYLILGWWLTRLTRRLKERS